MDANDARRYEAYVELLRARIGTADEADASAIHSLEPLMADIPNVPASWLADAVADLDAQGHLGVTAHTFGGHAARLSTEGRSFLRKKAVSDDAARAMRDVLG